MNLNIFIYFILKIRKKNVDQPYVAEFEKNKKLSIVEVNGPFYLKIKVRKNGAAELICP